MNSNGRMPKWLKDDGKKSFFYDRYGIMEKNGNSNSNLKAGDNVNEEMMDQKILCARTLGALEIHYGGEPWGLPISAGGKVMQLLLLLTWGGEGTKIQMNACLMEDYYNQAIGTSDDLDRQRLLENACQLYKGEFLPVMSGEEWVESLRSHYQEIYFCKGNISSHKEETMRSPE